MTGAHGTTGQKLPVMNLAWYRMCAVCLVALNDERTDTGALYDHPVLAADHDPEPAPADYVGRPTHCCHICSDPYPMWIYGTAPILSVNTDRGTVTHFSPQWRVCFGCAQLIESGDDERLSDRALKTASGPMAAVRPAGRVAACRAITASVVGVRGLLPHTPLPPASIMPDVMPAIRQRLIGLYSTEHYAVMAPVDFAWADVRDSLAHAPLYWINNRFTDTVRAVSPSQPPASITAELLPTTHGLLAWPQPVGPGSELAAVSWRPTDTGWELVGYRSIGNYLPKDEMADIRRDVGWLIPIHVDRVEAGTRIGGDDPLGPLVTTWLLMAQQLADITTAKPPPARGAKARPGKEQVPRVRLVQLKPTAAPVLPAASPTPSAAGARTRAKPDHRWWVSEHPRNQAHGPNRSERKSITIAPFLKGDPDKPIKLSTTVRLLGAKRTAPDQQAAVTADSDAGVNPPVQ